MTMRACLDDLLDRTVVGSFTNIGYALRSKAWDHQLPSLRGRVVIVTGATSGLGRVAAERLAALGAAVRLVARSASKVETARSEIVAATGNEDVATYLADLSETRQVRDLAIALLAGEPEIHVLVNNAGALFPERAETSEGIEMTLATDLLGPFLLTNMLLPRLEASAPARVVNVASGGMYTQRIRVDDLQSEQGDYKGAAAYARAKRGLVILTELWAKRLAGSGVVAHAMHPGWVDTPGVARSLPTFRRLTKPLLRTPEQGADTIVWLAASEEAAESSGRFWLDRRPRPTHRLRRTVETPEERRRLWQALEELAGSGSAP